MSNMLHWYSFFCLLLLLCNLSLAVQFLTAHYFFLQVDGCLCNLDFMVIACVLSLILNHHFLTSDHWTILSTLRYFLYMTNCLALHYIAHQPYIYPLNFSMSHQNSVISALILSDFYESEQQERIADKCLPLKL